LRGEWIALAGFIGGMSIKIREMPDCIVITAQNTRKLWGCAEGLKRRSRQQAEDEPVA